MSRKPSAETEVKSLRRDTKRLKTEPASAWASVTEYRARATRAETEAADWRKRFDLLLARTPTTKPKGEPGGV